MPYIGNTSPSRFVSNRAASVYSGDGSTTAFTLEQAVAQDEDVLVSVDGVIQEPSVAYAVSNGTTLTFTGAPSNDSGNNIFVYYLASQVGTVGHPSNQALNATTGTFSGAITGGGLLTTGGNVVIPDAGNIGSASDTDAMAISSGGVVTFSQKPVFSAGGGGKILQAQYVNYTTNEDYTTSFETIMTKSITPSATSSVILVQATVVTHHNAVGQHTAKLIRTLGGSDSLNYEAGDFYHPSGTGVSGNINIQYVDAPNTTSATEYKIQIKAETGTGTTNEDYSGTNNGVSSLVLMEIGA